MNKFGPSLGIALCAIAIVAAAHLPSSCSLTPEQRQQLQAISVPASSILSKAAISQGWIQPGDEVTIQRGVAVVVSDDKTETKLFKLAELGLDHAIDSGLLDVTDKVTLETPTQVTITDQAVPVTSAKDILPSIAPGELSDKPLPSPGG